MRRLLITMAIGALALTGSVEARWEPSAHGTFTYESSSGWDGVGLYMRSNGDIFVQYESKMPWGRCHFDIFGNNYELVYSRSLSECVPNKMMMIATGATGEQIKRNTSSDLVIEFRGENGYRKRRTIH